MKNKRKGHGRLKDKNGNVLTGWRTAVFPLIHCVACVSKAYMYLYTSVHVTICIFAACSFLLQVQLFMCSYAFTIVLGRFSGRCLEGEGVSKGADGLEFSGNFLGGLFHGQGTATYPGGSTYIGSWINNVREGEGTFSGKQTGKAFVERWLLD